MLHIMKLKSQYFDYVKNGTKEYVICLNDKKNRNIKTGDFIQFEREPLLEEKIIVKVDDMIYYDNFYELFDNIDIELLADSSVKKEELFFDLKNFYSSDRQSRYGVVAIKLRKNIIINNSSINDIPIDNEIFNIIRSNYDNFDVWLNKLRLKNIDVYYTKSFNNITSIMILKVNEIGSHQFLENENVLKIRTFFVNDNKKGIGKMYLDIVNEVAVANNINYIYLTIKKGNMQLLNYFERHGYSKYKQYNDEFVYYRVVR